MKQSMKMTHNASNKSSFTCKKLLKSNTHEDVIEKKASINYLQNPDDIVKRLDVCVKKYQEMFSENDKKVLCDPVNWNTDEKPYDSSSYYKILSGMCPNMTQNLKKKIINQLKIKKGIEKETHVYKGQVGKDNFKSAVTEIYKSGDKLGFQMTRSFKDVNNDWILELIEQVSTASLPKAGLSTSKTISATDMSYTITRLLGNTPLSKEVIDFAREKTIEYNTLKNEYTGIEKKNKNSFKDELMNSLKRKRESLTDPKVNYRKQSHKEYPQYKKISQITKNYHKESNDNLAFMDTN